MTEAQARKQAAQMSKAAGTRYVVWIFDEGRAVFDAEQVRMYSALINIEAVFMCGHEITTETAE